MFARDSLCEKDALSKMCWQRMKQIRNLLSKASGIGCLQATAQ